jgi:hypothetical protein
VKYALLAYDLDGALEQLRGESSRALHRRQGDCAPFGGNVKLLAHYRFRPAPLATIGPGDTSGATIRSEGAASETSARLRALYVLESDDPDAVLSLAAQLPATTHGATIEIWPLSEPVSVSAREARA